MGRLEVIVDQALRGMGYELVDTQVSNRGRQLCVFVDRPGGVTLDHCAEVSRHLTHLFAAEGIDYDRLEVSSPGLDRPLRKEADFVRFAGQKAELRMRHAATDGRRRYTGVLRGAAGGIVTLDLDGAVVSLELNQVERARLVPQEVFGGRNR
jgi:ribosome maturation factor RimP